MIMKINHRTNYLFLIALSLLLAILLIFAYNECDDKDLRILDLESENKFCSEMLGVCG